MSLNASDDQLLDCVRDWIGHLASGDYAAAAEFLHPPEREHAAEWTAERLKLFITNYGSDQPLTDGRRMTVTPIESARGRQTPYQDVTRFEDRPPMIEFDLPLDGEWSDLTAIFDLIDVDGRWAFALQDLHVL